MKPPVLVYLHGMNSSPDSVKAQAVVRYATAHHSDILSIVPKLSNWPKKSSEMIFEQIIAFAESHPVYIVGSSLGGYFATWLRETLLEVSPRACIKMVLINPAVRPYRLFQNYLGLQSNDYTKETYELTMEHVWQIEGLETDKLSQPERALVLLQTGDEILDYRQAVDKYKECVVEVKEGGSHAYEEFEKVLPRIFQFFFSDPAVMH